eukprot:9822916-Ditylum_brightwellii.AAC.1
MTNVQHDAELWGQLLWASRGMLDFLKHICKQKLGNSTVSLSHTRDKMLGDYMKQTRQDN